MPQSIPVRGDNITVDLLLHRVHGIRGRELIAETLRLNPGLAGLGLYIPPGTTVIVPDLPSAAQTVKKLKTLFG